MSVTVEIDAGDLAGAVESRLDEWAERNFAVRLWDRDATLWFDPARDEITDRLGWLCPGSSDGSAAVVDFATQARREGLSDVVLVGMGGSSLAPEVFAGVLGGADTPRLTVLDSTHPEAVLRVTESVDPGATLFVVSSKSGTTLETISFFRYLWSRVAEAIDDPGSRFIAITDPGSDLARLAADRGFRAIFEAPPDVGGRFSALIEFGLVPAALIGIDLGRLLAGADAAAFACGPSIPVAENPALQLGAAIGEFARAGRDKIVMVTDPAFASFPAWIEQLIAESLGKDGRGILPIADGVAEPAADRIILQVGFDGSPSPAGPSITLRLEDAYDLGGAMYMLEMATAAAGAVLGVHPFDQPDVQLAKSLAHTAMTEGFGDLDVSEWTLGEEVTGEHLRSLLSAAGPGGYVAIQAYLDPAGATPERLNAIAEVIAEATGAAVTIGFGPRFLHSSGQLHKGGMGGGVFLQIVDHPKHQVEVPETDYSFGKIIAAQSFGDQAALRDRNRPVGMVCLGDAGPSDLPRLKEALEGALR